MYNGVKTGDVVLSKSCLVLVLFIFPIWNSNVHYPVLVILYRTETHVYAQCAKIKLLLCAALVVHVIVTLLHSTGPPVSFTTHPPAHTGHSPMHIRPPSHLLQETRIAVCGPAHRASRLRDAYRDEGGNAMHPLYYHSRQYVGHRVYVHAYGQIHHGVLHQVTHEGVYLRPQGVVEVSGQIPGKSPQQAALGRYDSPEVAHVFAPMAFFPFAAMGALGPWYWW